jgi:hypothetical protein
MVERPGYFALAQEQAAKAWAESLLIEQAYCFQTNWSRPAASPPGK